MSFWKGFEKRAVTGHLVAKAMANRAGAINTRNILRTSGTAKPQLRKAVQTAQKSYPKIR